jgi:nucleotide-binding universal stress UspA family protein
MHSILTPIDFSQFTDHVIDGAARLAKALRARLWVLHVAAPEPEFVGYDTGPPSALESHVRELRDEERALEAIAVRLRDEGLDIMPLLVEGPTVETILEQGRKVSADLIVLGSHGHGAMFRMLVGSVSEGVLHKADRPVLIIPQVKVAPEEEEDEE